ncbi:hypothetical protein SAMN04490357_1007 [Streptomyces misionensis]|uniref:Uncharacterized protein n=1 Tax=Streptomyces misionensis TaxID=67331 RepID=A0A1H4P6S5_9ACTN|nr:hypothetical protein [Streptomyces misionensis]SEC03151.1 hypothetical protein SAMN04490357_1007 [Streptomyces misionensis]
MTQLDPDLRDRIAEAALSAVEAALDDTLLPAAREKALAGIAAVLPAPDQRAAVLLEAAEVAESLRQFERCTGPRAAAQVSENVGILRVAEALRRLAGEAQQDEAPGGEEAHTGGNAEDCPVCRPQIDKTVLYPWICTGAAPARSGQPETD